ncbi:MAG: DMT family transporter [Acidobacteriota bacterium]
MIALRGALKVIAAGALFAVMSAGVKVLSASQPSTVIVFGRNGFALLALLPWIGWRGWSAIRTRVLRFHLLRGLAGLTAMYCFFYTIGRLELADAVLLNYTLPLFMPLIAWIWLKEELTRPVIVAVVLGFVGVVFVVKPSGGVIQTAAFIGLAAGVLGALAQVTIRRLTRSEPVTRVVFYFSLVSTVCSAIPFPWTTVSIRFTELLILAGVGFLAALAQILLTAGYASGSAGSVGPFIYSSVVCAGLLDWLFWHHTPDGASVMGTVLICLGGIVVMRASTRNVPVRP